MDYKSLDVNDLVMLARKNDDNAFGEISERYAPMLHKQVSKFTSHDSVGELFNEARVGLHKAVMSYNIASPLASFGHYSATCVYNHLSDFLSGKSFAAQAAGEVDVESIAISSGIQSRLEHEEAMRRIKSFAQAVLSDYEYQVFLMWLSGYKTSEIAERLGQSAKSVDNAKNRMFKHLRDIKNLIDSILS